MPEMDKDCNPLGSHRLYICWTELQTMVVYMAGTALLIPSSIRTSVWMPMERRERDVTVRR